MSTPYQSCYWAAQLTAKGPSGSLGTLSRGISNARVDLNPHQVDAALFALRSPLSKGVVLADEVGLGKTIEAGIVMAQRWAERRRRILVIVPATLRQQWAQELDQKFSLPAIILESGAYNRLTRAGNADPFSQEDRVVICSYHFAVNRAEEVARGRWDIVVIDEAHRLRNVYKPGNKLASALRAALESRPKLLLTATPLQNSLLELYGLSSFIDPHLFGDEASFREQFVRTGDERFRNSELRARLAPVCRRTLRRQVQEYIKFTQRFPITWDFYPTDAEQQLYESVSEYLRRDELFALPSAQRPLITMVLRKLLASSSFAIAGTLRHLIRRLEAQAQEPHDQPLNETGVTDYEGYDDTREEWEDDDAGAQRDAATQLLLLEEIAELKHCLAQADAIEHNAKGTALVEALAAAFDKATELGAARKAVVFTESRRTQAYLLDLLERSGYAGQVVTLNGTNADERSKQVYTAWARRRQERDEAAGSRAVDMKTAIVEEFRDRSTVLVATEAAAEGINLQFCSLVVNYDLPWNPQRIEQRIGRCHRYGQTHDVVVVNFLNRRNAADQRVYELLAEKFRLFDGVFGASDEVLGALESGIDVERRIAAIYQECRTEKEISSAFVALQEEFDEQIGDRLGETRRLVLDRLDEEVQERLRVHHDEARAALDARGRRLLSLTRTELAGVARFEERSPRFHYDGDEAPTGHYHCDWQEAERLGDSFYSMDHPLAQWAIDRASARPLPDAEVVFDYASHGAPVAILAERAGQSGWLRMDRSCVSSVEEEERLLLAALTDEGERLDGDWCDRLLQLPAATGSRSTPSEASSQLLDAMLDGLHQQALTEVEARNGEHFEEEVDKLDRWAEDLKLTLERELKELDAEIRGARKESRAAVSLAEKLEAQRFIKTLEQRRATKRRELFDAQDQVDERRAQLIEDIERQLSTSSERHTVFTIRWTLN